MADGDQNKTLSEVSGKLSRLNGTTGEGLANVQRLTETLVAQSKASLDATEGAAAGEAEARKEAGRARKAKLGVTDVNVLNWDQNKEDGGGFLGMIKDMFSTSIGVKMGGFTLGSLFGKGGIKKLLATLGTTLFTGIKTAFASIGTKFSMLLGPTIMKFLGPAAIVAGLVMALKSGFDGAMNSMDWGVSKISGFLGGFFGGEADGGIKNSFKNAGKWAMIGAGIGSVVPVIGTLVGGLVGAAIGGILGFIGAKKIAKAFDSIGAWFNKVWGSVTKFMGEIWTKVVTWFKELWAWAPGGITEGWSNLTTYIGEVWTDVKAWFTKLFNWGTPIVLAGWTNLTTYVGEVWTKVKTWFTNLLNWAGEGIAGGWTNLTTFVSEIWTKVKTWFNNLLNWKNELIATGWTNLTTFVSGIWTKVKTWFTNLLTFKGEDGKDIGIVEKVIEMFKNMIENIVAGVKSLIPSFGSDKKPVNKMNKEELQAKAVELKQTIKEGKGIRNWSIEDEKLELANIESKIASFAQGGVVKDTGLALLHGKQSAPELVLDNRAASLFMQAAQMLSKLQLDAIDLRSPGGTTVMNVVNNTPVTTNNSRTIGMMPSPSIRPESPNILPA